jgi:hypothetical protein
MEFRAVAVVVILFKYSDSEKMFQGLSLKNGDYSLFYPHGLRDRPLDDQLLQFKKGGRLKPVTTGPVCRLALLFGFSDTI